MRWILGVLMTVAVGSLLAGCGGGGATDEPVGLANPAAVYCEAAGYTLTYDEYAAGYCELPDGARCEEWAFARGQCGAEFSYCTVQGYTLEVGEGMATCRFPDGGSCPELDFALGLCRPEVATPGE